jgi:hypothetical protein
MPRLALSIFGCHSTTIIRLSKQQYLNTIEIKTNQAIADTGATSIFIMEETPVNNLRPSSQPLTINLPDSSKAKSTHMCDITISGLPTILTGHIVLKLTIASLIGIRLLCKAGCSVVFTKSKCDVIYNEQVIFRGLRTQLQTCGRYYSTRRRRIAREKWATT